MSCNLLEKVEDLTLYTGTYGRKKCTCSCIGCTQESYGRKHEDFQGTIEQIKKIIKKLPNLKTAYILGNPDVSVDTEFCNLAAKEFIKSGKKVMFSTSGYKAMDTLKKLIKDIKPEDIEYISYSIDTMYIEKLRYLKGNKKINFEEIEEAIKYCNNEKIKVKIQPTIWNINQDDYIDIIEFFYSKFKIDWFTFHAGSFESLIGKEIPLEHVKPEIWRNITNKINEIAKEKKLKIIVPRIFLDEEEFIEFNKNSKLYCKNGGTGIQIWMQKDGIKATFCPLLAEIFPEEYIFDIEKEKIKLVKSNNKNCLICEKSIDEHLKKESTDNKGEQFTCGNSKIHNVCRFYSYREDCR